MINDRRDALKRGFMLIGAAVGIGTVAKDVLAATNESSPEIRKGETVVLEARALRITSRDLRRGELPTAGVRMLATGDIIDPLASRKKVGSFVSIYQRLANFGKVAAEEPGAVEQHTFILKDGTILGSGIASAGVPSEGQFAIVGGTGKYAGAKGSYVARQNHANLGGNGTATFTLTLL